MNDDDLTRRDFQRLTLAAFSGIVWGASMPGAEALGAEEPRKSLLDEPHVCRGLNTCKAMGRRNDNACAGQGKCANATLHECAGKNSCKGQGGCGLQPGENDCSGKGKGPVLLSDKAWKKARKHYEEQMTKAGKKYGPAPPKDAKDKK
jgi:hypothetical protein